MILHTHISEIYQEQWDTLVKQSPTATFFQTRECFDFYNTLSFMKPFIYGVSENNKLVGLICGYIIFDGNSLKQYFSRRAIVPGGVLLAENITQNTLVEFLKFVTNQLKKKAIYLELRNYNDYSTYKSTFESAGFAYQSHLNFHVDTSNEVQAKKRISESKLRQFKLAENRGVSYEQTTNVDDIISFYNCLNSLYERIRKPLFPLEFFLNIAQLPSARIFVVKQNNIIIGGMTSVFMPQNCMYEWFVCGEESDTQKLYPSVVATIAGINYAIKHNIKKFDFMGAGKPDKEYGVREFKSKFGGELVEHGRFLYICSPLLYNLGRFAVSLKIN